MKQITVKLNEGQYLNEVEPFKTKGIPTDTIIHKVIPGCGATTLEIKHTKRNSIIIVPNVPVIEDKVSEHNKKYPKEEQILGVYQSIDVGHIEDYLNSEATYKKILTTPEGFLSKVLVAFENDIDSMINDYFLLFDECERIVTDVSYRGQIAAPIEWFFRFKQKAMVSATTLAFSHKDFADFDHYAIEPTFDYSKAIEVINTNNVVSSLEAKLSTVDGTNPILFFVNSTRAIFDIADILKLIPQSNAYCADTSVAKLTSKKFRTSYSKLDLQNLKKYNFLTSRYYSALDIKLDYKPDVILITDVFTAKHSVLDPHTEIIQIAGRFRNGVNSLTHITNFDSSIESKSREEGNQYLKGCFDTFENIVEQLKKSKDEGSRDTLKFFVQHSPVAEYYTDGKLNPFMVDNYHYQQRVQGYYQSIENLKLAYADQAKHFTPEYITEEYVVSDEDRVKRQSKSSVREQQWETLRQIDRFAPKPGVFILHNSYTLVNNLRSLFPWLTEAYDLIGLDGIKKTGLSASKLNPVKARAKELKELRKLEPFVNAMFDEHSEPEDKEIKRIMVELCDKANITLTPTISLILQFFEGSRSTKGGKHIHRLRSKIDLSKLTPFD